MHSPGYSIKKLLEVRARYRPLTRKLYPSHLRKKNKRSPPKIPQFSKLSQRFRWFPCPRVPFLTRANDGNNTHRCRGKAPRRKSAGEPSTTRTSCCLFCWLVQEVRQSRTSILPVARSRPAGGTNVDPRNRKLKALDPPAPSLRTLRNPSFNPRFFLRSQDEYSSCFTCVSDSRERSSDPKRSCRTILYA